MDHNEAVRQQVAVKYVLGELPQAERDSFEEHYFDCTECALDMQAAAVFAENARNLLRQEARGADVRAAAPAGSRWFAWFKPVVAVPAFAVLLLFVAYQNVVTIPRARQEAASRVLPMYSLIAANTRGSDSLTFKVRPGERFGLYVDVPTDTAYRVYLVRLVDPAGHSEVLPSLFYEEAQKTQVVEVNPGERSGSYQVVVSGLPGLESDPAKATILATMKFIIEFNR
ncbi:MAG: hypothetical protein DMG36_24020 [Acidobacteria bacterium]|nr:MAG: hypothetical protein DMG36_24020 [Acidobacteriota bacterium]